MKATRCKVSQSSLA